MKVSSSASWNIHWLQASGDLRDWQPAITEQVNAARKAVQRMLPVPELDILIQCLPGEVIAEMGLVGYAYRSNLFSLTVDPGNPNFATSLDNGTLLRQLVHEVHHCLRMAGPGYGRTLGEALVSEGLAGHFVRYLLDSEPEPWECAIDLQHLRNTPPAQHLLNSSGYDHGAWFFGTTRDYPRWLGYSLGYQLVGHWIEESAVSDEARISVTAETVISAGVRAGLIHQAA